MKHYQYAIYNKDHGIISRHYSYDTAYRQQQRNLAWRCGICGNNKKGWGQCSHGIHNQVCNADHYNDRIIFIK